MHGFIAWLEHDISTGDDGHPISDGLVCWLGDSEGSKVQIPLAALEGVARGLVDAAATLRQ